jgi:hypothetical protein
MRNYSYRINKKKNSISHCLGYFSIPSYDVFYQLLRSLLAVLSVQMYIFPPLFYGCKTWSLILRDEHGLGAFENRLLMGVIWPSEEQQTGEWRRLHDLYSSTMFH